MTLKVEEKKENTSYFLKKHAISSLDLSSDMVTFTLTLMCQR